MNLLEEGSPVARPVQAEQIAADRYVIQGPVPDTEIWEFPPGTTVCGRMHKYADGQKLLTAVAV